jgi:SAM-dependent methyltransferase
MVPIARVIWHEALSRGKGGRLPEPIGTMDDPEQVKSYVKAYEWDGPTAALQLHHLRELSRLIGPGDVVVDLACGPGPLVLELAALFRATTFVAVDLSSTMLQHLRQEVDARRLGNVAVLQEDIRTLPSLKSGTVDLVISTSALHHLPDETALAEVFSRIGSLLAPKGGYYLFDFGLLKSREARTLFVREVAKLAPPITALDYAASLDAAFSIDVVSRLAESTLPRPYRFISSAFVGFCYWLQTLPRVQPDEQINRSISGIAKKLSLAMKTEHMMLRSLRASRVVH